MSIGSTLTQARSDLGLTLEDIAARTRIRRTLILGMENDDFSACGGDFYARGHLRNVATTLGLDPAPLLAEFDRAYPTVAPPRATEVFESETQARRERRGPNWSAAMAVALVLVVGYGIVQVATGGQGDGSPRIAGTLPSSKAPATPSARTPSTPPPPPAGSAIAQAPRDKVTVVVRSTGRSWVQVTTGTGQELFQGLLQAGARQTFTDKSRLKLVIGNAGAVDLVVNGTDVGPAGRPGQVARVQFTRTDPGGG